VDDIDILSNWAALTTGSNRFDNTDRHYYTLAIVPDDDVTFFTPSAQYLLTPTMFVSTYCFFRFSESQLPQISTRITHFADLTPPSAFKSLTYCLHVVPKSFVITAAFPQPIKWDSLSVPLADYVVSPPTVDDHFRA